MKKKNGKIKCTRVDPRTVSWFKMAHYQPIYKAVAALKVGQAIKVNCCDKNVASAVRSYIHKHQKGSFRIRSRRVPSAGVTYLMKQEK